MGSTYMIINNFTDSQIMLYTYGSGNILFLFVLSKFLFVLFVFILIAYIEIFPIIFFSLWGSVLHCFCCYAIAYFDVVFSLLSAGHGIIVSFYHLLLYILLHNNHSLNRMAFLFPACSVGCHYIILVP